MNNVTPTNLNKIYKYCKIEELIDSFFMRQVGYVKIVVEKASYIECNFILSKSLLNKHEDMFHFYD